MIDNNLRKIIAIILLIGFVILLIPTLYVAQYNHPCEDDYSYGTYSSRTYNETNSIVKTVGAAFESARDTYISWQGTFTGVVAMCLGPYVFNIEWYDATTYILLAFLICGTSFLTYKVLVSYLKADIWTYIIVNVVILIISIELVPHPTHSFFWYNGSILYTSFYSLALIVYGLTIGLMLAERKGIWKRYILLIPLIVVTGLGNTVISLNLVVIMTLLMGLLYIRKNKKYMLILPLWILAIAMLAAVIFAPGSIHRQAENASTSITAIDAIIKSFAHGFNMVFKSNADTYNETFVWLGALALVPFVFKYINMKDYEFKYPWLVMIISFCILSSMFTPPIYVFGKVSNVKRIININFFASVLLIFFNIFYLVGYFNKLFSGDLSKFIQNKAVTAKKLMISYYILIIMIAVSSLSSINISNNNQLPLSVRALKVILNDTGKVYDYEYHERLDLLKSDEMDLLFEPYSYTPDLLYFNDISDNPEDWTNEVFAKFSGKDSVALKPIEQ